jgi:hypothetical protein
VQYSTEYLDVIAPKYNKNGVIVVQVALIVQPFGAF